MIVSGVRLVRSFCSGEKYGLGFSKIRSGLAAVHKSESPDPLFLSSPKTVAVVGAPMTYGQPMVGTDRGPQMLRDAGLHQALIKLGWRVQECGDIEFPPVSISAPQPDFEAIGGHLHQAHAVGTSNGLICEKVAEHAAAGQFVLTLGGDHSIGMGTVGGVLSVRPQTGVIWVDAHADINTPRTSSSGNMHGMPLSFLMGLVDHTAVPGFEWMSKFPKLDVDQLVYIALRDIDEGERHILRELKIKAYTMMDVDHFGIGAVMEKALHHLQGRPLHLSYDIDAVDPAVAPATGTVVRGGLTFREACYVAEAVAASGMLGSLDMVEVNPMLGGKATAASETVDLGLVLTASALGSRIL